mmetsp:Transcript_89320/g.257595  ORF Transcript_89320/g.257595 Transcript_89320/m.257595 type:complete len:297 (+) Transcript_89320:1981-2871(+)
MPQTERGQVLDDMLRLLVHVQRVGHDVVHDEVQSAGRLLEEVLARRSDGKELLEDLSAEEVLILVLQAGPQLVQGPHHASGFPQKRRDESLDVVPQPRPSDFVVRVPVPAQRAQRSEHHRLVSGQINLAFVLRKPETENVTLLVQAVAVRDMTNNRVEGGQDLVHPSALREAHDCGVEDEHVIEVRRHRHVVSPMVRVLFALSSFCLLRPGVLQLVALVVMFLVLAGHLLPIILRLVGDRPTGGQDPQAVFVVVPDVDEGSAGVVEQCQPPSMGSLRPSGAELDREQFQDGVPEDC